MICYIAGHVERLRMIKKLRYLFSHGFNVFAEVCGFAPCHYPVQFVKLVETISNDSPKLLFCIVGN